MDMMMDMMLVPPPPPAPLGPLPSPPARCARCGLAEDDHGTVARFMGTAPPLACLSYVPYDKHAHVGGRAVR